MRLAKSHHAKFGNRQAAGSRLSRFETVRRLGRPNRSVTVHSDAYDNAVVSQSEYSAHHQQSHLPHDALHPPS